MTVPVMTSFNMLDSAGNGLNSSLEQLISSAGTEAYNALQRGGRSKISINMADAIESLTSQQVSSIKTYIGSAIEQLSSDSLMNETSAVVNKLSSNIMNSIVNGIKEQLENISITDNQDTTIATIMASYRSSLGIDQARSLGKMKAQLASQGGANGTALTYASMMLEDSTNKNVAQYEAQLRTQMIQINTEFYSNLIQVFANLRGNLISTSMQNISNNFNHRLNAFTQAFVSTLSQLLTIGNGLMSTEMQLNDSFMKTLVGMYGSFELAKQDKENLAAIQWASQMLEIANQSATFEMNREILLKDISIKQADAYATFLNMKAEWNMRRISWPIDVLQKEANILAAPAGAVVAEQKAPGLGYAMLSGTGTDLIGMGAIGATKGIEGIIELFSKRS